MATIDWRHLIALEDETVLKTVCAAEKARRDMYIAVQKANDAQAQQGRFERARTSVASQQPSTLYVFSGPSAAATTLSVDAILRHILNYIHTREPWRLACVCKTWRDATMQMDALWEPAARTLLPFTYQADTEAVKALVRTVGGYRALVMGYAKAVAEGAFTAHLFKPRTTPTPDLKGLSLRAIFELRDRLRDCVVMSELGQAVYEEDPYYFCLGGASIYMKGPSTEYQDKEFMVEDMLLPPEKTMGRGGRDAITQHDRFVARFFVVSEKRLSLLYTTTFCHDTLVGDDDNLHADVYAYHSHPTCLPSSAALNVDLKGSITIHAEQFWDHRLQKQRWNIFSGPRLGLHTDGDASLSAGLATVLHALFS